MPSTDSYDAFGSWWGSGAEERSPKRAAMAKQVIANGRRKYVHPPQGDVGRMTRKTMTRREWAWAERKRRLAAGEVLTTKRHQPGSLNTSA